MVTHELKTWPEYYESIDDGSKSFECRKNDRDFHTGDRLLLREWDYQTKEYTGRSRLFEITFILIAYPGLVAGYVVMAIRPAWENKP